MNAKIYTAAIIGLGRIGWKFDDMFKGAPGGALTHAGAFEANPNIRIIGGYSPDPTDSLAFKLRYGVEAYDSIEQLLAATKPDIVSICSPNEFHFEHTLACLNAGVPMIWLEKPATVHLNEVDLLIERKSALGNRSKILVNYQRRYIQRYQKLRETYQKKILGEAFSLQMTYARGLELNGCHLLDFAFFLTGDTQKAELQCVTVERDAENPSFTFRFSSGLPVYVTGLPLPYHLGDVTLTCEKGRAAVIHGGMKTVWEDKVEHELYPGFHRLKTRDESPLGLGPMENGMNEALMDLIESYENGTEPVSNLVTAQQTQFLLNNIFNKVTGD